MSTLELRTEIYDKLNNIDDIIVLKKVKKILKNNEPNVYNFRKSQIKMLEMSEEDIKFGRVISQEQLDKEDLEWLSKM